MLSALLPFPGIGPANRHMPGKAAEQTLQTESRDQQRAAPQSRSREPLQGDHKSEIERHCRAGIKFRQFKFAIAQGTTVVVELLRGDLSK